MYRNEMLLLKKTSSFIQSTSASSPAAAAAAANPKNPKKKSDSTEKQYTYYVLLLRNNKYYVGKTTKSAEERLLEHRRGEGAGSAWTNLYPPINIIETFIGDRYRENGLVLKYMDKYGTENVRGGMYSQICLSKEQESTLEKEFINVNDRCWRCGKSDHFAKACSVPRPVVPEKSVHHHVRKTFSAIKKKAAHISHSPLDTAQSVLNAASSLASNMFNAVASIAASAAAATAIDPLPPSVAAINKKRKYESVSKHRFKEEATTTKKKMCWRCGHTSHFNAKECFATKDIHGTLIDKEPLLCKS